MQNGKPEVIKLNNGMRLVLVNMPGMNAVTVLTMVGVGSRYETEESAGISHFLEHMPFKGTKNYPNSLALAEAIDGVGGKYNAFTSKEYTGYWVKLAADKLGLALDVVSDLLLTPKLTQEDIEMERGVILEEINMYHDNPQSKVGIMFDELVYRKNPLSWFTAGSKESVGRLKRKDFLAHYNAYYDPSNVTIGVVGKLQVTSNKLQELVEDSFGKGDERSGGGEKKLVDTSQSKPRVAVHFKETEQAHFRLGFPSLGWDDKRRYDLMVLATILGGNSSSWMFNEIREKRGLAYYAYCSQEMNEGSGSLVAFEGVKLEKIEEAIKVTREQFAKMASGKVKEKDVERAKEFLVGKTSLELEDSSAMANLMVSKLLLEGKVVTVEEMLDEVRAVTLEGVKKMAGEIIDDEKLNLAVVGPFKDEGKFEGLIR